MQEQLRRWRVQAWTVALILSLWVAVAALALAFLNRSSVSDTQRDLRAAQEQLTINTQGLETLQGDFDQAQATLQSSLSSLEDALQDAHAALVLARTDLDALSTEVSSVKGTVTAAKENISSVRTDLASLVSGFDDLKNTFLLSREEFGQDIDDLQQANEQVVSGGQYIVVSLAYLLWWQTFSDELEEAAGELLGQAVRATGDDQLRQAQEDWSEAFRSGNEDFFDKDEAFFRLITTRLEQLLPP